MPRSLGALALVLLASPALAADSADKLAAAIDRHLAARWKAEKVKPAPIADDAEFARRAYLDIVGRIPRVSEVRAFLEETSKDKRAKLIDSLLGMPAHATHFAAVTRASWVPSNANPQFAFAGNQMEPWLRERFLANTPADEVVKQVLTVPFPIPGSTPGYTPEMQALLAFYQSNESKPETVAAAASRLFLGVKLECAQCHDHPFNVYTRDQFWEFAAFFADVTPNLTYGRVRQAGETGEPTEKKRLKIPNTDRTVEATFFDGTRPEWSDKRTPRQELAAWLTTSKNPYFARNLANRTWAHFFGLGLLDPVDEPGEMNPPSHPELLDELAKSFAQSGFDNRYLIRAITRSKAYQRSSRQTHESQADPRQFARMSLRGLTPGQIFDSFATATGHREQAGARQSAGFPGQVGNARADFLARFANPEKATETQTSILQALLLMNGSAVNTQTNLQRSETLAAIADAPFWTTKERVEAIFLAVLTRKPSKQEAESFGSYVDRGGTAGDKGKALADVFWVLLNSTEFLFNH